MNTTTDSRWNPFRRHALGSIAEETPAAPPTPAAPKSKTWQTTIQKVESWPEEARPLKKRTWLTRLYSLGDIILVLLPIYFIRMFSGAYLVPYLTYIVLGVAVITLNGKPTHGSAFGSKVEKAMDLVNRTGKCIADVLLTFQGPHTVPHSIRRNSREEHENDCTISCRKGNKNQCKHDSLMQLLTNILDLLTEMIQDVRALDGKPVRMGHFRKPVAHAKINNGRYKPLVLVGSISSWRSGFASTHVERYTGFLHKCEASIHDHWTSSKYVGVVFNIR